MKMILASLFALIAVLPATACYECGQIVQQQFYYPVVEQVQYRLVQPQLVRETIQLERQTIERDPIIVERQERVIQYQVQPQIQQQYVAVQKVRVQQVQVQKVHVQPVIVQKQVIQKQQVQYAPAVIEKSTTQKVGPLGRVRQQTETIKIR